MATTPNFTRILIDDLQDAVVVLKDCLQHDRETQSTKETPNYIVEVERAIVHLEQWITRLKADGENKHGDSRSQI